MTTLTDRYVAATVRGLEESQRADVERELRATIADMVDARLDAGAATPADAEHAVLTELGDPMRLAAGYSGRPLHLIGPAVYPQWRRVVTVLLSTLVPLVTAVNLVVRLFVDDVATDGVGPAVVGALMVGLMVAVNVVVWVTVVFALAERRTIDGVDTTWRPEQLPEDPSTRSVGLGETVTSVSLLVLTVLALVWQQTNPPVRRDGDGVPVLDPALWSGWIPLLIAVLVAGVVVAVLAHRAGRWTPALAAVNAALDLVAAASVLWLLATDALFNPAFTDVLVAGGWTEAARDLSVSVTLGVVVVTVWDQVDSLRRLRSPRPSHEAGLVA